MGPGGGRGDRRVILSIDPASRKTGWAVLKRGPDLLDFGVVRGREKGDTWDRIASIIEELHHVVGQVEQSHDGHIEHVVIEAPDVKVHRRYVGVQGLAVYGVAVGAIWQACLHHHGRAFMVRAGVWTGGHPKEHRARYVGACFPQYDPDQDKGFDAADAIGLGLWWLDGGEEHWRRAQTA